MPNTATKADVSRDLEEISAKISSIARAAALGVLAIAWGFLVTPNTRIQVWSGAVLAAIVLAFLALLLDWLQYLVGYLNGVRTWNTMEKDAEVRGWTPDWLYGLRGGFFGAKQAAAFAGVVVLIAAMLPAIVRLVGQ